MEPIGKALQNSGGAGPKFDASGLPCPYISQLLVNAGAFMVRIGFWGSFMMFV